MSNANVLSQFKGVVSRPDMEIFKIGPEVIEESIAKLLVVMGAEPADIQHITISNDRKRLRISAILEKDSTVFTQHEDATSGLALLGKASDEIALTERAKAALRDFGYFYVKRDDDDDDDGRDVYLVQINENKKNVELQFNEEVTLAIITDTDFTDEFFVVDAIEESVTKKKHNSKKFKGKKKTVVFARVYRSFQTDGYFDPAQVDAFRSGEEVDDEDEDEDEG